MSVTKRNRGSTALVAMLFFAATASTTALAVDVRNMMEGGLKTLEADLSLSAEQKQKVDPILQSAVDQRMAVLKEYNFKPGNRPSFMNLISIRSKMSDITTEVHRKLVPILSQQQMEKFDDISEQMRQKMRSVLLGR
jgi:uncharacterized protein YycO